MSRESTATSLRRRTFLAAGAAAWTSLAGMAPLKPSSAEADEPSGFLPTEPLEIGNGPQFVFDRHAIDNVWALKYKSQTVRRVAHAPTKYAGNPLIPPSAGAVCVRRDAADGRFRMWYQSFRRIGTENDGNYYCIRYAESDDGLQWTLPKLGLVEFDGSKDNNIVLGDADGRFSSPFLIDAPEADCRGYKYLLQHSTRQGTCLVGSHDGIHFDPASHTVLKKLHSDTQNSIVYDPHGRQYLMFCRAKHVYRTFQGDILDTGESRRIARMAGADLWGPWTADPQNILVPDEVDFADDGFNAFYGMPTRYYGGLFWGALWRFRFNDEIHTQLAFSRDGVRFDRLEGRPKFLAVGPEGAWDDGMAFGSMHWVEVGDEWWFYYAGSDGPHGTFERDTQIGLAKLRKEGFVSMRGPALGGVLASRPIRWSGGDLVVNADAAAGELRVRVAEASRKPRDGFNYDDCTPFTADAVRGTIRWGDRSLDALKGEVVRLEFLLKDADLYTFLAKPNDA